MSACWIWNRIRRQAKKQDPHTKSHPCKKEVTQGLTTSRWSCLWRISRSSCSRTAKNKRNSRRVKSRFILDREEQKLGTCAPLRFNHKYPKPWLLSLSHRWWHLLFQQWRASQKDSFVSPSIPFATSAWSLNCCWPCGDPVWNHSKHHHLFSGIFNPSCWPLINIVAILFKDAGCCFIHCLLSQQAMHCVIVEGATEGRLRPILVEYSRVFGKCSWWSFQLTISSVHYA